MRTWQPVALLALSFSNCSGARMHAFATRDGSEIARINAASSSGHVLAGDLELRAGSLRAVIAGTPPAEPTGLPLGSIRLASFARRDRAAPLAPVIPFVRIGGREARVVRSHVEPMVHEGHASVRWYAELASQSGLLVSVERDVWFDVDRHALVVQTRFTRTSPGSPVEVTAGLELRATSGGLFAPGHGLVSRSGAWDVPWLALSGDDRGWVVFDPDGPSHVAVNVDPEADSEPARALAAPNAQRLAPNGTATFATWILGTDGDIADLAGLASLARRDPVVQIPMHVQAHDPIERSFVVVTRLDGAIVLLADMSHDYTRVLPLVPGDEYLAYAFAHGHTTSEAIRFTATPGHAPITLEIPEGGRIRVVVRRSDDRTPLPVRLVVRGIDGTPDPVLGPMNAAAGAGHVVVTSTGRAEFAVPAGDYEVTASHGPEWTIAHARTRVTPTLRGDVTLALAHVIPMNDWTACDLHVHSIPSGDSAVSTVDRVAALVAEGVEFAAATEHNTVGDYTEGMNALPSAAQTTNAPLTWIPAVEVTTDRSPHPVGHFNVYPFVADRSLEHGGPPPFEASPSEIFRAARVRQADGVIQVNHPRMEPNIGYFDRVGLDPRTNTATSSLYDPHYDAIEVFNGYYLGAPDAVDRVLHDWFALLGTGAHYVGTANSDSHVIAYQGAGYPRTYVYTPGAGDRAPDVETLIASLRAGHVFGSSGPMLFVHAGDAIPGGTVHTAREHIDLSIEVRAAPWVTVDRVTVYRDGEPVLEVPIPPSTEPLRLQRTFSVPVTGHRSFVVVTASGPRGSLEAALPHMDAFPFAFTNPIWIEPATGTAHAIRPRRAAHRASGP
jgi:hypothetical protein